MRKLKTKKVARKAARKITNWSAYNNALKSRGNLSIFLAEDVFKQDALKQKNNGKNGHPCFICHCARPAALPSYCLMQ